MQTPTTLYLDNAATTPLRPEARAAMEPFLGDSFANASSLYASARQARKAIDDAREQLASAVGARPEEVIFTGSGTEADNLALKGAAWHAREQGRDHIVIGATEHEAVANTAAWLSKMGFRVSTVGVDANGIVHPERLREEVEPRKTAVVSVMWANNEVGTVQPIVALAQVAHDAGALFHTDAVQALRFEQVDASVADLTAFSAHKLGGPKGVGALIVRRGTKIEPVLHGGGQERGLRSSTYNVAGIAGFGAAAAASAGERDVVVPRIAKLRGALQDELVSIGGVHVNGAGAPRLPGHVNVCIEGIEGEPLILLLDAAGVAASSGSACTSGSTEPSHVLLAMGVPRDLAVGSLRLTLGPDTTEADVDRAAVAVRDAVKRLRR